MPSALFSLSTCFFAHKNTLCLSQSVPLSALSLSLSCGLREKIEKKTHLQTVHTPLNCLQDTLFVCRTQCTHAIRRLLSKTSQRCITVFPDYRLEAAVSIPAAAFIRLPANTCVLFSTKYGVSAGDFDPCVHAATQSRLSRTCTH